MIATKSDVDGWINERRENKLTAREKTKTDVEQEEKTDRPTFHGWIQREDEGNGDDDDDGGEDSDGNNGDADDAGDGHFDGDDVHDDAHNDSVTSFLSFHFRSLIDLHVSGPYVRTEERIDLKTFTAVVSMVGSLQYVTLLPSITTAQP